jgi:uncharacterized protein (DUF2345 family)
MFLYGDKHLTLHSPKIAHLVSGDTAHVKAEKGVEIATDDWIFITTTKIVDVECDDKIKMVAKGPGGIEVEAELGSITGKAMKSIDLTAQTTGVSVTAQLANIDLKAAAGQITGMGTAGISWSTPAAFSATAGAALSLNAGLAGSLTTGLAANITAGAACNITAVAAVNITGVTINLVGVVTVGGVALL